MRRDRAEAAMEGHGSELGSCFYSTLAEFLCLDKSFQAQVSYVLNERLMIPRPMLVVVLGEMGCIDRFLVIQKGPLKYKLLLFSPITNMFSK